MINDKSLGIETGNLRNWPNKLAYNFNRLESTAYDRLELLSQHFRPVPGSQLVDYGAGSGRVLFYLNHIWQIPVDGIEFHEQTFKELEANYHSYHKRFPHHAPIKLHHQDGRLFQLHQNHRIFYFFNPFSILLFRPIVFDILRFSNNNSLTVYLILYYPHPDYLNFLEQHTPFQLSQTISPKDSHDWRDCFYIYHN
ncbi:class I SAM-dependent methyltransferase [Hutsoniella sourekii]|uniref:hypothetical protein n=1 Tax=Hutsoniella sourekii TaxID=87650 RepID=UPI00048039A3|nr:hypothetical protein [Hutsoniella sourekii]